MFSHCMLYVDILQVGILHVNILHVYIDILHAGILHVCIDILLAYCIDKWHVGLYTLLDDILCMQVGIRMSSVGMA